MASKKTSKNYATRTPLTQKAGRKKSPTRAKASDIAKWEKELAYFQDVKQKLVEDGKYINQYVAVKNKKIIDSDKDEIRLVRRINEAYPHEVVLIAKVDEQEDIGVVRSPRVAK